jgi:Abi-like protein
MKYPEVEKILSSARMSRYISACDGNTNKAMTLYRQNLRLSQEFFTVISCFEVALRNAINVQCILYFGNDWLRDGSANGGIFDNKYCLMTAKNINEAIQKLKHNYSNNKLVAELGFGFWVYFFTQHQYTATGRILLKIFPEKPKTTRTIQYNHTYIFDQLKKINNLRNRIAHHEPICFQPGLPIIDTNYVRKQYELIQQLLLWMDIDMKGFLYGLDHINIICDKIDNGKYL